MIRLPSQLLRLRQKEKVPLLLLVVLLISVGAVVWILTTLAIIPGSWSPLLSVIFTVLSVLFTVLQWHAQITGGRRPRNVNSTRRSTRTVMVDGLIARRAGNLEESRRLLDLATQDTEVDASLHSFLKEDAEEADYVLYLQSIIIPVLYQCRRSSREAVKSPIDVIVDRRDL